MRASILAEPQLEFGFGQLSPDPHSGLALFGPYDSNRPGKPKSIRWGLIATSSGREKCLAWVKSIQTAVFAGKNRHGSDLDYRLWPVYPGFQTAFDCILSPDPAWYFGLDEIHLAQICSNLDSKKRAYEAVEQYLQGIQLTQKKDEQLDILICVVPDVIQQSCRPKGFVKEGTGFRVSKREQTARGQGQSNFFEQYDPDVYNYSEDFRRQIKARCMPYNIPIQIIKESTLTDYGENQRRTTPPSDLAWNLTTTMYYKAGGKPWKLAGARPGVSYIGIAFRLTDHLTSSRSACSAAQMFLDSGDGVVFLGETGLWYSPQSHEFHLSHESAKRLLTGVLEVYRELEGQPLKEIFLHCRSGIRRDEFAGYRAACPADVNLVAIRVRKDWNGIKAFREGDYPVRRGTLIEASERAGFLFASGVIPNLGTYPGTESPVPLRIDIQHGEAPIQRVASDVLALTKLNYNACKFGDSEPVTIGFSDSVGEILVSNPKLSVRLPKFKYYI
jgi:hypothetical protein